MAKQCNDCNVLCPFYCNFGKRSITCEGITSTSVIRLCFNDVADRDIQRKIFCCNNYSFCEIYRMLEKKY